MIDDGYNYKQPRPVGLCSFSYVRSRPNLYNFVYRNPGHFDRVIPWGVHNIGLECDLTHPKLHPIHIESADKRSVCVNFAIPL